MSFVTKLKRQMTMQDGGPEQQCVAAGGPHSLARGFQSLATGRPGGEMGVGAYAAWPARQRESNHIYE